MGSEGAISSGWRLAYNPQRTYTETERECVYHKEGGFHEVVEDAMRER